MKKKKKINFDYKVPYGYFENLEERIVATVKEHKEEKTSVFNSLTLLLQPKKIGIAFAAIAALIAAVYFLPQGNQFDLDKELSTINKEEIEDFLEFEFFNNDDMMEEVALVSLDDDSWNLDQLDEGDISDELKNYDELEYLLEL